MRFGGRKSDKLVRAYDKPEVHAYRVEVELHAGSLRTMGVETIEELPTVTRRVTPEHIRFYKVAWASLQRALMKKRYSSWFIKKLQARQYSIPELMRKLRTSGISNPRRFLVPLKSNQLLRDALKRWAREFTEGGLDD